jgi:hypothetical protein
MKIPNIFNIFKKKKECKHDEYCPLYLAHVDNNDSEPKACRNNTQYCIKYRLIDDTEWKKLSRVEKMKIIRDMELFNFIKKT